MISNMLRFPLSMFEDDFDSWFYPQQRAEARAAHGVFPAVNVGTTDKNVDVYLFAPGVDANDLDVVIEKNLLSVSGERKLPEREGSEASTRLERFSGKFKRVITLPEDVDADKAEAVYQDGVLHISIAKPAEVQPRQIQVSVN
jgi:HSP20 family protein